MTKPMEDELTTLGVKALKSPKEVDTFLKNSGTSLIVINSVCGCGAGSARPGVKIALKNKKKPLNLGTVFAGVDLEAVAKARSYIENYPPSSPSIALFKEKKLLAFIPREEIAGKGPEDVAEKIKEMFNKFC